MAIDNAQFISEMNTGLPDKRDPRGEGAQQIQAVKVAVQQSFPNVDKAVTATADVFNEMLDGTQGRFRGEVTFFSGLFADIPTGWAICDGSTVNNYVTPDLRGKFIMGYDVDTAATYPERATGGSHHPDLSQHLTVDGHALTPQEIPEHSHGMFTEQTGNDLGKPSPTDTVARAVNLNSGATEYVMGRDANTAEPTVGRTGKFGGDANGDTLEHSHGLTAVEDGNQVPTFDNRPEFAVLIMICYVGVAA